MASDEGWEFAVTIPAGTLKSAPAFTPTVMPDRIIDIIRWRFPPGPSGLVGIQIASSKVAILPRGAGQFYVASGEMSSADLASLPTTGDWGVYGYNTGTHPHTIYISFMVSAIFPPEIPRILIPDRMLDNIADMPAWPYG